MPEQRHRRLVRLLGGIAGTVVLLGLWLVALLQLPEVRGWLLRQLLERVNAELNGELSIADLRLRGLSGVELYQLALRDAAGDTIAAATSVRIAYEAFALTQRRIVIPTLSAEGVRITLVRGHDSLWNLERVLRRREPSGKPPELSIWLRGFYIRDATVAIVDSLALAQQHPTAAGIAAQGRWLLREVELLGSAALFPRHQRVFISLRRLHAREHLSGLVLDTLRGHFAFTPTQLRAEEVRLQMPGIGLYLNGELTQTGSAPFSPEALRRSARVHAILRLDSLIPQHLTRWFPPLPPIPDTLSAKLELTGTARRLQLQLLSFRLGRAYGSARLTVTEPLDTARRSISGVVESGFVPTSLLARLQPQSPPQLQKLRFLRMRAVRFTLSPDRADIAGQFTTALGEAKLSAQLSQWNSSQPSYRIALSTSRLELTPFSVPPMQPLVVSGTIEGSGSGREVETATLQLRISLTGGQLGTVRLQQALAAGRLANGLLQLDSLSCRFIAADTGYAALSGWVQLKPVSSPSYRLQCAFAQLPLAALLGDPSLPTAVSATVLIAGRSLHPDSIEGFIRAHVHYLEYPTWSSLPFELSLQLSRPSASVRFLQVTGDFLSASLEGRWRVQSLPEILRSLSTATAAWIARHRQFLPGQPLPVPPTPPLPESADIRFRVEIRDLAWLGQWTKPLALQGTLSLDGALSAADTTALLRLNRFHARFLSLGTDSIRFIGERLRGDSLVLRFQIAENIPVLANFSGTISAASIRWAAQVVDSLQLRWQLTENAGTVDVQFALPELISARWAAEIHMRSEGYLLVSRFLSLRHTHSGFSWESPMPATFRVSSRGIALDTLVLERLGKERIRLWGSLGWDSLQHLQAELLHARISELLALLPPLYRRPELLALKGELDTLAVLLSGALPSPRVDFSLSLSRLSYDTTLLGTLRVSGTVAENIARGTLTLEEGARRLRLVLSSLPIQEELYERVPVAAYAEAQNINAAVLAPFVVGLRIAQGSLTLSLSVGGYLPFHLQFSGSLSAEPLVVEPALTGITYNASLRLALRGQTVTIEQLTLRNLPEDLPEGVATISGTIGLRQLQPWSFDLQFRSPQLLVLGYSSARVNPLIYGPLVIATGQPPVQLVGTWEKPRLTGTLLVRTARLILPGEALTVGTPPSLLADYTWVTSTALPAATPQEPSTHGTRLRAERGFGERLSYDLRIYFLGTVSITMDLAPTQQLIADLEAENPAVPLAYVTGPEGKPQLLGRLRLRPGSVYKFYRNFSATGTIAFTTGEPDNPELDIEVRYQGVRLFNNQRQTYEIRFTVRGTRRNLTIGNWSYTIAGTPGTGDENKLFNDIVWLLLIGRTQEELESGALGNGAIGQEIPLANLSTIASKAATELFRGVGIIQDVQIDPTTGTFDLEQMRARITGQLGGITVRWGGVLGNPLQQAEFTVEMPLSELLRGEPSFLRQVLLQLSTTTGTTTVTLPSTQRVWEVRISVRL